MNKIPKKLLLELNELSLTINSTIDTSEILKNTCKAIVSIFNIDHCGLVKFKDDLSEGITIAEYPIQGKKTLGTKIKVEGIKLEEELVKNQKIIEIQNLVEDNSLGEVKNVLIDFGIKSTLIIPVVLFGKVIASFSLDSLNSIRPFKDDEKFICKRIATLVAVALRNSRILTELNVLNFLGNELSITKIANIDEILNLVYKQVSLIMEIPNFYIAFYHEKNNLLEFKLAFENSKKVKINEGDYINRINGRGLSEYIIHTKEPLLISSGVESWLEKHENCVEKIGKITKSWLGIPIIFSEKVIGVIGIQNFDCENVYDEGHKIVLQIIASQTAFAINYARLLEKEHKLRTSAEILKTISQYINEGDFTLSDIAIEILDEIEKILEYKKATFQIINDNKRELIGYKGFSSDSIDNWLLRPISEDSLLTEIFKEKRPYIISSTNSNGFWTKRDSTIDVKSWIGLPLLDGENIIGLITFDSDIEYFYNYDLKEFLLPFSIQLGSILKNARLKEQKDNIHTKLLETAQIANPGMIALQFTHETNHYMHYLNTDISMLINLVPLQTRESEKGKLILESLTNNSDYLRKLFGSLISYAKSKKVSVKNVRIREILEEALYLFNPLLQKRKIQHVIKYDCDKDIFIECDKNQLVQVFINLFNNSIYALKGKVNEIISIYVREVNNNFIEIQFKDFGVGIPAENIDTVFEPLFTTKGDEGSGFGLAICKRIICDNHSGEIKVQSEFNKYTTFFIKLPRKIKYKES